MPRYARCCAAAISFTLRYTPSVQAADEGSMLMHNKGTVEARLNTHAAVFATPILPRRFRRHMRALSMRRLLPLSA